ncbi:MAG: hypothetical protein ACLQMO_16390 [Acidobacteriaceae bacterium]
MPLPLTSREIEELYGTLARVLHDLPATQMRVVAGDAGWDRGQIPDGLDETGKFTRRPLIDSAIDGQWAQWDETTKAHRVRRLGQALIDNLHPKGMAHQVDDAIRHCGFNFVNGDFVPVDATGRVPD